VVFDAAWLALFSVTGALKAVAFDLAFLPAALLGMLTAIGGGMVRDLLAGRVPLVLRSEIYATPALVSAAAVAAGASTGVADWAVAIPAAVLCLGWRLLAMWRGWQAPRPGGSAST
jgi:uncharacterized membrane protein YeiH